MATILETFFTRLGFEVDESGLKNAQTKIAGLGKNILGLGIVSGLSIAGIVKLTTSTAEALGNVQKLSDRTGLATMTIAGMNKAAAGFGVTNEGVASTLESVNKALGGIVTGTAPRMKAVFKTIGISATDAAGQQKDVVQFLGDVAERIRGMSTGAQQQILSRLGIDPQMITMLRNGREEFLQLYQTAAKGVLFRPEDYTRSEEFMRMFARVKGITRTIGQGIGLEIMKPMGELLEKFSKWWTANGSKIMEEMRGRLKGWMDAFSVLGSVFSKFADKGDLVVRIMELFAIAVAALIALKVASWIGGIISALGPWGVALLAIGAIIWLIIDDFKAWKRGGESVIGYFEQKFPGAFELMRDAVTRVRDAALQLWKVLKQFWAQYGPAITNATKQFAKFALIVAGALIVKAIEYIGKSIEELAWLIEALAPKIAAVIGFVGKAFNAILEWIDRGKQWFSDLGEHIAAVWERVKVSFMNTLNDYKNSLKGAVEDLRFIWQSITKFFQPEIDAIKEMWKTLTDGFSTAWDEMTTKLRDIWQKFVGWLEPWLSRIEKFFGFVTGKASDSMKQMNDASNAVVEGAGAKIMAKTKEFAKAALDWLPTMQKFPSLAELTGTPAMAAPAGAITNAQRSQTQNTEVKATINVQAPSPEAAAEMTATKIENLAQLNTRYGQSFAR